MSTIIARKQFDDSFDALLARQAEEYIASLPHGAGTWRDGQAVNLPSVEGAALRVADKVGTEQTGSLRHIEVLWCDRVVVTLEYSHRSKQLVRTF